MSATPLLRDGTGRGPGNYLQALRVAVAKEMLEDGARSVQAVGSAVGYADTAFFRDVFKRGTGMTPGEYRVAFGGGRNLRPDSAIRQSRPAGGRMA